MWVESETMQSDLEKFLYDKYVKVAATRGYPSTPFVYQCCNRLRVTAERYPCIEKIVILYFGDSDESGQKIRKNIEGGLWWYQHKSDDSRIPVGVELRHIAITEEQVEEHRLTGYQLEAFFTTVERLKIFKRILFDAMQECWNENVYKKYCPPKIYDYKSKGETEPKDIDVDMRYMQTMRIIRLYARG